MDTLFSTNDLVRFDTCLKNQSCTNEQLTFSIYKLRNTMYYKKQQQKEKKLKQIDDYIVIISMKSPISS